MIIANSEELPDIKPGRPGIYPFEDLQAGQKLIIPCHGNYENKKVSVRSSLNYFKKKNGFTWKTIVVIEHGNIVAYRIN